ncbi:hypothetical protein SKAU_G00101930 [Synaphobranchus kaupii]|uniref:STAS domain-containing protein n=1 Tax=Synaphobranchus kaupii TaxID=118154 RepID=A0A9Q1FZM1_SYNKA|nr:hypothetical protein SKAU_G00101930 [Synaphobranchus kaupii]
MSRSMVQESTGGKTQVAGAVSVLVILIILLNIGDLFQQLPKAVLAAVILVNLQGMFGQFRDMSSLYASDRMDLLVWVISLVSTLLFNLDLGLAASMAFSLLTVVFRTQNAHYTLLGHIPGTDCYRDLRLYSKAKQIPGVTIFSCSNPLYFANADMYFSSLSEAAMRGREQNCVHECDLGQEARYRYCVILELSAVVFMDTVSISALHRVLQDWKDQGIVAFMVGCPDTVRSQLQTQGIVPEFLPWSHLFPSVHHAVQRYQRRLHSDSNRELSDLTQPLTSPDL